MPRMKFSTKKPRGKRQYFPPRDPISSWWTPPVQVANPATYDPRDPIANPPTFAYEPRTTTAENTPDVVMADAEVGLDEEVPNIDEVFTPNEVAALNESAPPDESAHEEEASQPEAEIAPAAPSATTSNTVIPAGPQPRDRGNANMVTTASTLYPGVNYPKPKAKVMRGKAWTEELDTELLRLRALGLSIREIAADHMTDHSLGSLNSRWSRMKKYA